MLNTLVTECDSAHPINNKIATLSQEARRVVMHCSPDTPDNVKCDYLEKFIARLGTSGYDQYTIAKIVRNGIMAHYRALHREKIGGRKVNRGAKEGKNDRVRSKLLAKTNWYKTKDKDRVSDEDILEGRGIHDQRLKNKTKPKKRSEKVAKNGNKLNSLNSFWGGGGKNQNKRGESKGEVKIPAVLFVPHTPNSELARLLREKMSEMGSLFG